MPLLSWSLFLLCVTSTSIFVVQNVTVSVGEIGGEAGYLRIQGPLDLRFEESYHLGTSSTLTPPPLQLQWAEKCWTLSYQDLSEAVGEARGPREPREA